MIEYREHYRADLSNLAILPCDGPDAEPRDALLVVRSSTDPHLADCHVLVMGVGDEYAHGLRLSGRALACTALALIEALVCLGAIQGGSGEEPEPEPEPAPRDALVAAARAALRSLTPQQRLLVCALPENVRRHLVADVDRELRGEVRRR